MGVFISGVGEARECLGKSSVGYAQVGGGQGTGGAVACAQACKWVHWLA